MVNDRLNQAGCADITSPARPIVPEWQTVNENYLLLYSHPERKLAFHPSSAIDAKTGELRGHHLADDPLDFTGWWMA